MDGKIALSHFAGHMGNVGEQGIEGVHNAFGGVGQYTHFILAFDLRSRSGQVAFLQQGQMGEAMPLASQMLSREETTSTTTSSTEIMMMLR